MSGWFGTSNPEVDGPFQGIGAGYARRRNAQRRRYDPLGRGVVFEDLEANDQGQTGPSDPGEVARFNRKKAEQEMANTYMPAIMPRDFTVGGYTVRATFNPQLQNYIVSVLHGMGTMEKHTYNKNEGQAAINKHAQLVSLAKKVAKYDTQTPKIVEKTNYNVALEVKTGAAARVYDQVMEFLGLGAVTPVRGSTTAEVDTSILRRIEERNGFQETPNQVPREITARTTVMDRKIITQPGSLRGHSGTSINWKAMRQKSFRVVVIRKDRTEVFSSNWDGDYDKTVALYNSTVATVTNSPDFYDQDEPVVLPVTPANGGGGDITDPMPIDPGLLPTEPGQADTPTVYLDTFSPLDEAKALIRQIINSPLTGKALMDYANQTMAGEYLPSGRAFSPSDADAELEQLFGELQLRLFPELADYATTETEAVQQAPIDTTPIETTPIDTPPESSENYNDMTVDTREIDPGWEEQAGDSPGPLPIDTGLQPTGWEEQAAWPSPAPIDPGLQPTGYTTQPPPTYQTGRTPLPEDTVQEEATTPTESYLPSTVAVIGVTAAFLYWFSKRKPRQRPLKRQSRKTPIGASFGIS